MQISEIYSLSTGLKTSQPFVLEDFFPVDFPLEDAILINTSPNEKAPSKNYDYFSLVCDFLKERFPSLLLVQISDKPTSRLNSCNHHIVGLKPGQAAYFISHCKGLLSGDHLYSYFAAKYQKKSLILYGSTSAITNCANPNEFSLSGTALHPTYQAVEQNKNVNTILPETVVEIAAKWLIDEHIRAGFETKCVGESFLNSVIEVIPNSVINPQLFPEHVFNIRMDYLHDEEMLDRLLSTRKYNIVASQPINPDLLFKHRGRIGALNYELREDMDFSYCKNLKKTGVKTVFFTRHEGEKLKDLRFRALDLGLVEAIKPTEKKLDPDQKADNLLFKTNKYLLSNGQIYLSHAHCLAGKSTPNFAQNAAEVIDSSDFWKDQSYFYIYQKTTNLKN
jgi:hypothetical protein